MTKINLNGEYVEVDDLCVTLLLFFNNNGLKTKFSCQGHEVNQNFYILFDESVTDEMILEFLKDYWAAFNDVHPFRKWTRIDIKNKYEFESIEEYDKVMTLSYDENVCDIMTNWVFEIEACLFKSENREEILEDILDRLNRIENQTKK